MSVPLLEVRGLTAAYGQVQALHGLDFAIVAGSVTALLGANGAGKTTTLRALTAMVKAAGDVRFEGRPMNRRSTEDVVRYGIAHVPQGRGTFTRMTVAENLALGAMTRRDHAGIRADIERMYGYFPILRTRREQQAGTLSGGEQQMLDEPSFGLAPLVVRELFGILAAVNRDEKVSMMIVEQNAGLALGLASHAYLLETGRIVLDGPSEAISADEGVRRAYLGY